MGRRILVLLVLALAVVASGCVVPYGYHDGPRYGSGYYGGRSHGGGYYGDGYGRTVVVQRPVVVYRPVRRPHRVHRREWVREHRHHRGDRDHDRRDRVDWRGPR